LLGFQDCFSGAHFSIIPKLGIAYAVPLPYVIIRERPDGPSGVDADPVRFNNSP
jgi:hypothetical protein